MKMRLQRLMAQAGVASRRKAEELILAGKVKVNGRVVRELGTQVDPERAHVEVNDVQIHAEKKTYYLLNKPDGYITSRNDEFDRPVVFDLVPKAQRLVSAGRLDFHTEGVLLLTNDGDLVHALTHPSAGIAREYEVKVRGELSAQQVERLLMGVLLDDGPAPPVAVEKLRETDKNCWYQLTIYEGRNREVRRIMEAVGATVLKLKRTTFAGLRVDDLPVGEHRSLGPDEVLMLYQVAGLVNLDKTPGSVMEPEAATLKQEPPHLRTDKKPSFRKERAPSRQGRAGRPSRPAKRREDGPKRDFERPAKRREDGPKRDFERPAKRREESPKRDFERPAKRREDGPKRDFERPAKRREESPKRDFERPAKRREDGPKRDFDRPAKRREDGPKRDFERPAKRREDSPKRDFERPAKRREESPKRDFERPAKRREDKSKSSLDRSARETSEHPKRKGGPKRFSSKGRNR